MSRILQITEWRLTFKEIVYFQRNVFNLLFVLSSTKQKNKKCLLTLLQVPSRSFFWREHFLKPQKEKNRTVAHFFLFFSQSGKMFANNLSCVYKICRTHPHPAPPSLHLLRPESACLLTSNPPLLNTFDIRTCNCACDCIWICICQNCDEKNTTRISVRTYTFTGPGLTQGDYSPGTLHQRRPPPLTLSEHHHLHFTETRLLFTKDGTWGSLALASQLWPL